MSESISSNTKPLRIALLGAGALGRGWSKVIAAEPGAELAAIVDPLIGSEREPEWLGEAGDVPRAENVAALGDVELDAAVVTAFSPAHAEAIRAALERGLHVIVEKPFTTTMADARSLVDLAARRGLTLMVSQNYRFFPGVATIRAIVDGGDYGAVRAVIGQFWCDWPGKPYQLRMEQVMGLEMAVHHFDLARAMFDAEPAGGFCREWNPAGSQYAGGGAIEALFEMRSPRGAFLFVYSGSLVGKAPRTPWGGLWRIELDRATVVVDTIDDRYGVYRAHGDGHEHLGDFAEENNMKFDASLEHFVASIRGGKEPWCSGRDNLNTMEMALGAVTFGEAGRRAA